MTLRRAVIAVAAFASLWVLIGFCAMEYVDYINRQDALETYNDGH